MCRRQNRAVARTNQDVPAAKSSCGEDESRGAGCESSYGEAQSSCSELNRSDDHGNTNGEKTRLGIGAKF